MQFEYSVRMAFNSLAHRKMRSWLTLFGIIIGVAAVVAIVSIGEGAQASVNQRLSSLGADVINVSPGYSRAGRSFGDFRGGRALGGGEVSSSNPLTDKDILVLKSFPDVAYVNEMVSGSATATFLAEESRVSVQGINPVTWRLITTSSLGSGRYLSAGDWAGGVLGYSVANEKFKKPITLGNTIVLNKKPFTVVGVLAQSLSGHLPQSTVANLQETVQALVAAEAKKEKRKD